MKDILDLYSTPANFTYRRFNLYPSICGGIVSIIIQILLLVYLVFLIIQMTKRDVPIIYESTMHENIPSSYLVIPIDKEEVFEREKGFHFIIFSIRFNETVNNQNITNDDIKLNVEKHSISSDGSETIDNITYEICNYDLKKVFPNEEIKDFNQYYCIKENYVLKGNIGFPDSSWIEIILIKNSNNSLNVDEEYQIQFYYQYNSINLKKYNKDIIEKSLFGLHYVLIDDYTKIVDLDFSVNEIATNDYFLPRYLVGKYKSKYYLMENNKIDQIREFTDNTIFKIRFHLSRNSKKYIRRFDDIITILAVVGGLAGIAFPIGFLFVCLISNFRMNEDMMNDRYNIMDPVKDEKILPFNKFIHERKQKLIQKYFQGGRNQKKNNNENNNNLKDNDERNQLNDKNKTLNEKCHIEMNDDLINDDGLNEVDANPVERFFTLRRILDMYNYDIKNLNNNSNGEGNEPLNDPQNIDQAKYIIYKFIYDNAKYKSQPDFSFNLIEMIRYYFFITCCRKKRRELTKKLKEGKYNIRNRRIETTPEKETKKEEEKENKKDKEKSKLNTSIISNPNTVNTDYMIENITKLEKKFLVYDGAKRKLGMDFDLINILKTIEGFDSFKKVFLEKHQEILFNAVTKDIIDINMIEKKKENKDKEEKEYEDLLKMNKVFSNIVNYTNGKIEPYIERLMYITGRKEKNIKTFQKVINGENIIYDINKDIDLENKSEQSLDSISVSNRYATSDFDKTSELKDKSEQNISILDKKGVKKEIEENFNFNNINNNDNNNHDKSDEMDYANDLQKIFGKNINGDNSDEDGEEI